MISYSLLLFSIVSTSVLVYLEASRSLKVAKFSRNVAVEESVDKKYLIRCAMKCDREEDCIGIAVGYDNVCRSRFSDSTANGTERYLALRKESYPAVEATISPSSPTTADTKALTTAITTAAITETVATTTTIEATTTTIEATTTTIEATTTTIEATTLSTTAKTTTAATTAASTSTTVAAQTKAAGLQPGDKTTFDGKLFYYAGQASGVKYYASDERLQFKKANDSCEALGMQLARLHTEEQYVLLRDCFAIIPITDPMILGYEYRQGIGWLHPNSQPVVTSYLDLYNRADEYCYLVISSKGAWVGYAGNYANYFCTDVIQSN